MSERSPWSAARQQVTEVLQTRARQGKLISYSELAGRVTAIDLEPHDIRLAQLLGEVSAAEDQAGRGMLSVLVVHKDGDARPGRGFYKLAEELGHSVDDPDTFWAD